jgi:hypothetical protein
VERTSLPGLRPVALSLATVAAAIAPSVAVADSDISHDPTATGVSAFGGALVWSRKTTSGRHRLVQLVDGAVRDAPVAPAAHPFQADLGPGRRGGVVAVYSRCRANLGACDVFQLDLESGVERRVPAASRHACSETAPSVWKGTLAFAREGRCRAGLYMKRPGTRAIRLARIGPDTDTAQTDIRGRTVAAAFEAIVSRFQLEHINLFAVGRHSRVRRCLVTKNQSDFSGSSSVENPVLDAGHLYWTAAPSFSPVPDPDAFNGFERTDARCGAELERAPGTESPESLAVAGGALYYGVFEKGIFQADDPAPLFTPVAR